MGLAEVINASRTYFPTGTAGRSLAQRLIRFIETLAPEAVEDPHGLHRLQLLARQGPEAVRIAEQSTGQKVAYRQEHAVMDALRALGRDPHTIPSEDWYKTLKAMGFDKVGSLETGYRLPSMKMSMRQGSKFGVRGPDINLSDLIGAPRDQEISLARQQYAAIQQLMNEKIQTMPRRGQ
jgi:hypothetical protein